MEGMFRNNTAFNQDIGNWDVSKVTDMSFMFYHDSARVAFNQDISYWNVSSVTNMGGMFGNNTAFNQDIRIWAPPLAGVALTNMFNGASDMATAYSSDSDYSNTPNRSFFNSGRFVPTTKTELVTAIAGWINGSITANTSVPSGQGIGNYGYIGNWDVRGPCDGRITDMSELFSNGSSSGTTTSFNDFIGNWDVMNVTNMSDMFDGATLFNQDIGKWNVSAVITMDRMFANTTAFNQDIGDWNVSAVTDMGNMFQNAAAFNQDIGQWNVSKVENMKYMFSYSGAFDQDIGQWNVSAVTDMSGMFIYSGAFNQNIGDWNVSAVTNMNNMFQNATAFNNGGQSLNHWNVSAVTNMSYMFKNTTGFNQDITKWNVSSVDDMEEMFNGATTFDKDIRIWAPSDDLGTTPATGLIYMFNGATAMATAYNGDPYYGITPDRAFFNSGRFVPRDKDDLVTAIGLWINGSIDATNAHTVPTDQGSGNYGYIGNWNVSQITDMSELFKDESSSGGTDTTSFNDFIGNWDVSNVTNMQSMFNGASTFDSDITKWDVSAVQNMHQMFRDAAAFNQDIGNWNVSSVEDMHAMFNDATQFNQDIGNWNVGSVTTMQGMFKNATNFNQDLNSWEQPIPLTTTTITVTVDGNGKYVLNGNTSVKPVLKVGHTYIFDLSDSSNSGHPLVFHSDTSNTVYNTTTTSGTAGQAGATVTFVPAQAGNAYLVCTTHGSGMGSHYNPITVIPSTTLANVTNMQEMFRGADIFNNGHTMGGSPNPLNHWNVSAVTNMEGMFRGATAFTRILVVGMCLLSQI